MSSPPVRPGQLEIAHVLVMDLNQSPFNVGTRLTLEDFSFDEVSELNRRHGDPLPDQDSFYRLRCAGVLSGESSRDARARCQLYATYLERHLL